MTPNILLVYASKSGTTVEVAEAIGRSLDEAGAAVDVIPVRQVNSLEGYDAVIIGSSIRMGSWLKEATIFVEKNQYLLNSLPTAIFTVHMLNLDDTLESVAGRKAYVAPIKQMITPVDEAFFAGRIEMASLSLFERFISKALDAKDQDLRDWKAIRAWGPTVNEALST